jgi:hypothetical protein
MLDDMVSYGVKKVRLSQPNPTIDKEGIIVLGWQVSHGQASRMGELVARSHHKMIKRIFWIEDGLEGMERLLFIARQRFGNRILSIDLFIPDSELQLAGYMGQEGDDVLNMERIVFVDPLLEESVRDFQLNLFSFHREKVNGLNPDVEILLTDPFF